MFDPTIDVCYKDISSTLWSMCAVDSIEENKQSTGRQQILMDSDTLRRIFRNNLIRCKEYHNKAIQDGTLSPATVSNKVYCSVEPFRSLKLITVKELKPNFPAKGFYLLLRAIENSCFNVGITTVVEDHAGNTLEISAYNMFSSFEFTSDLGNLLAIGTIFILKEPLLKISMDKSPLLRSDCPSDIIILKPYHQEYSFFKNMQWKNRIQVLAQEMSERETWKEKGNAFFKGKKYVAALDSYMMALEEVDKESVELVCTINMNISATYLLMGYFEAALRYAEMVLKHDPVKPKALFRAGRAHYELRHFEKAHSFFSKLVATDGNTEATEQLKRCENRLKEQTGNFDIYRLFLNSLVYPETLQDCADFVGNLKVVSFEGRRRGVVATEDIEAGELLVVSKALVAVFKGRQTILQLYSDYCMCQEHIVEMVQELTHSVKRNPEILGKSIYDLPVNDRFLDCVKPKLFCDENTKEEPITDVERIKKIVSSNYLPINTFKVNEETIGSGVFQFPSYFKHKCIGSTSFTTFNDVLVMHATKPIKKNEEVTITRISPFLDYSGKEKYFALCEYTCDCRLCELDRAEPEHFRQKRNGIFSRACSLVDEILAKQKRERIFDKQLAREVSILLDQVQEMGLNSQRKELQISLAATYGERAFLEILKGSPLKDIRKLHLKELRAMGFDPKVLISDANGPGKFIIPENAIYTFTVRKAIAGLVITYYASGDLKEAKKWLYLLTVAEKLTTGANVPMFLHKFDRFTENEYKAIMNSK